jgi:hypothetical protein
VLARGFSVVCLLEQFLNLQIKILSVVQFITVGRLVVHIFPLLRHVGFRHLHDHRFGFVVIVLWRAIPALVLLGELPRLVLPELVNNPGGDSLAHPVLIHAKVIDVFRLVEFKTVIADLFLALAQLFLSFLVLDLLQLLSLNRCKLRVDNSQ